MKFGTGPNNNNGMAAKQQIYGTLLDREDKFSLPKVNNRSTLEKKPQEGLEKTGASSNFMAHNRKYSIDGGAMGAIEKSRFIGLGMQTLESANNKQFKTPNVASHGDIASMSSRQSNSFASPRLLNAGHKVGGVTDKQHDALWGEILANDTKKHKLQTERKKMEIRNNNNQVQSYLKSQMVQQFKEREHEDRIQQQFGVDVAKLSKQMIKEDKQRKENHRAMIRQNAAVNQELAEQKQVLNAKNSHSDLHGDNILNARKIEVEARLQEWEREKEREKKIKLKNELDKMIKERANQRVQGRNPLTEETLKQLKLDQSQV